MKSERVGPLLRRSWKAVEGRRREGSVGGAAVAN